MTEKINSETLQAASFDIILHSGNARTPIYEAFHSICKEMFEEVEEKLGQANEETPHAHQSRTQLLRKYTNGARIEMGIIMVHAQDHLMTTMILLGVVQGINYLYQKNKQKGRIIVQGTVERKIELEKK